MKRYAIFQRTFALVFSLAIVFLPRGEAQAETLVGSTIDNRVVVAFSVDTEGVQPFLPEGWAPIPFPRGPYKGGNLLVALIDREMTLDAEGNPVSPPHSRHIALAGVGKQTDGDGVRLFVYRIYESAVHDNPFGNSVQAGIFRLTSTDGATSEGRVRKEKWTITPRDGGEIQMSLSFSTGPRIWSERELKAYSSVTPDTHQIWRDKQLIDLLMSVEKEKSLDGEFSFSSTVPELAAIFDGTEKPVAILDIPVYSRDTLNP